MSDRLTTLRGFTESLLAGIDIVDIVSARLPLRKKSNNNYFACCPFHQEKSASFSVSEPKQFYYCFGCGAHGNAIDFLIHFEHMNFMEALKTLAQVAGMSVPTFHDGGAQESAQPVKNLDDHYALMDASVQFYYQELKTSQRAIQYLKKRGISGEVARQFKMGYAPSGWRHLLEHFPANEKTQEQLLDVGLVVKKENDRPYDRFRDRIMFPIQDHKGRYIGFGGRILDQGEPKYLNSPETLLFQKGQTCYGLYQVLQQHQHLQKVVIVEGYMDVIALFQHGITYAVATLGTATTAHHIKRLLRYTSHFYFCFDGDEAGRRAARRALETLFPMLTDEWHVRFLFLPEKEDPDSIVRKEGKEGFEARLKNAVSLSDFFLQTMSIDADLSSMEGRAAMTARALLLIKLLPPIMLRDVLLTELGKRVRLDVAQLKARLESGDVSSLVFSEAHNAAFKGRSSSRVKPKSLLYKVLALLIQKPSLATLLPLTLPESDEKGWQLLKGLAIALKDKENPTFAVLMLQYDESHPDREAIINLANWPHGVPDNGMEAEFKGAIDKLFEQERTYFLDKKINMLHDKKSTSGLNDLEEKELLHLRQALFDIKRKGASLNEKA